MRVVINGKHLVLPSCLRDITLGQRIDFYNQYGRNLDEKVKAVLAMPDGIEKELEVSELQFEKMFCVFAFFTGTTPEALKQSQYIDDIANIYFSSLAVLMHDEETIEPQQQFFWKDCEWELHPPELQHGSKMAFGEFIDSKQMIKDMADLGAGKWEAMQKLAAIYLRKKGEPYQESFLYPNSERLAMMLELPMDIALQVAFFLTASVHLYMKTSPSFSQAAGQKQVNTASNISTASAGLISSRPLPKPRYSTSPAAG